MYSPMLLMSSRIVSARMLEPRRVSTIPNCRLLRHMSSTESEYSICSRYLADMHNKSTGVAFILAISCCVMSLVPSLVTLLSHCCHTQRTNFPDRCALLVFIGVNRISASHRPRTLIKSLKIEAQALKCDCPCRVTSEWRRVLLLYMVRHTCGMTKPQCEPHRYQPINHGYGLDGLVVRKYLALREQGVAGI